jgi:tRNA(Arg) A34 adenosine deaminase TadA
MPDLAALEEQTDPALLRCLELAHAGLLAGGLPVGAVITDGEGHRISEGRNRAYDPAGGDDRLQRTPVAHAEMNALAAVEQGTDLSILRLTSSHRPCQMCAAACEFTGVGEVVYVAPDPSDAVSHDDPPGVATAWVVVANLLFLAGIAAYSGWSAPAIALAREREPEVFALMRTIGIGNLRRPALRLALAPAWPEIEAAARQRRERR